MGWAVFEPASTNERVRHHAATAGDESGAQVASCLPQYFLPVPSLPCPEYQLLNHSERPRLDNDAYNIRDLCICFCFSPCYTIN